MTIGDLGQIVTGKTPPTKIRDYYGKGYKFITPTDLEYFHYYLHETDREVTEKAFNKFRKYFLPPNSISYTCIGNTIGKSCMNRKLVLTNQQINSVIPNDKNNSKFIYYYLNSVIKSIRAIGGGSATPIINKTTFSNIRIVIPPLPTQRKIAAILSAYDDLIENNLKRIKLLEEKAQLTYQEWFSVRGLPEGWNEYRLGDLIAYDIGGGWGKEEVIEDFCQPAYVIRGTDFDDIPRGSIENVPYRWHKASNLKSRKLQNGDIIFEVSGGSSTAGVGKSLLITDLLLSQFDEDVMCASFCKLMRPINEDYSYPLILFLKYLRSSKGTEIFEKRSASNIVNYNWKAFMKFQKIKMPEKSKLKEFNRIIRPMLNSATILGKQIRILKEARDILLPRLMTGMIDVEEIV